MRLASSRDEAVVPPVLQLTLHLVGLQSGNIKVFTVSVDVTRKRVDWTESAVPDGVDVDVGGVSQWDSRAQPESGLPLRGGGGGGVATRVDCGTFVVGGPASAFLSGAVGDTDFAGDVGAGVASLAILAGDVATGLTGRCRGGVPG